MARIFALSIFLGFGFLAASCAQSREGQQKIYPRQVADITPDSTQDDPLFNVCHPEAIYQYYNFGKGLLYKGEKIEITRFFQRNFKAASKEDTGYLTIRFVVNCEGKTGRFRVEQMGFDYQPKNFSPELTSQLLHLTTQLQDWGIAVDPSGQPKDYYQYLTFKLRHGNLEEILP